MPDLITREFPDFDLATLPAIPAHWLGSSWRNDTCPSFQIGDLYQIFIDYPNPAEREWAESCRYTLHSIDDGGGQHVVVHTDNWNDVLYVASVL